MLNFSLDGSLQKSIIMGFDKKKEEQYEKFTRFDLHLEQIQNYYHTLKKVRSRKTNYKDKGFPAGRNSLASNWTKF